MWHDLADDDYIHPVVGREYVLKGTERLHPAAPPPPLLDAAAASSSSSGSQETPTSTSSARWEARGGPAHRKKSASSCGAADELGEYVVYKGEERAADAATQTEDDVGRGRGHPRRAKAPAAQDELSRADTSSPPTASTSPETLEALIKADGRVLAAVSGSGRARAPSVLMQLISCGSVSVQDAHASPVMPRAHHRHHHHHHRARPPRPPAPSAAAAAVPSYRAKIVEDKEYFSGSIIETAKRSPDDDASQDMAVPVLRRSSSYNADR